STMTPPSPSPTLFRSADDAPPTRSRLGRGVEAVAAHYQADRYDDVARLSPALVRSAHAHVDLLDGDDRTEAIRLRSDSLQLTARYLIQIREHDLSLIALRDALTDALAVGDHALPAH